MSENKLSLDEYQERASTTDMLGDGKTIVDASNPAYVAKILGLAGESGEVAEKYKKIIRDHKGIVSKEDAAEIAKELGDVLWYVAMLARYAGYSLEEVAQTNLSKLASRKERGTQNGSGDNR